METMSRESLIKAIEDRDEIIAHLARVCLNWKVPIKGL